MYLSNVSEYSFSLCSHTCHNPCEKENTWFSSRLAICSWCHRLHFSLPCIDLLFTPDFLNMSVPSTECHLFQHMCSLKSVKIHYFPVDIGINFFLFFFLLFFCEFYVVQREHTCTSMAVWVSSVYNVILWHFILLLHN